MKNQKILNLFYEEPEADRWFPYDRFLRKILRRIFRGKPRPGGQMMVALNLMKGLEILKIPYRFNDYAHIKKNPTELACIIGKPFVLDKMHWKNPILFGASVFSHPLQDPNLLDRHPTIQNILVPGEWMKQMFEEYYPGKVSTWPVGIDTEEWSPKFKGTGEVDFLIYDKIRWNYSHFSETLIHPIKQLLLEKGYSVDSIRYMYYKPEELKEKVSRCRACIFLCEHETQGLAYQQILSTGTPIFAWDRGGYWEDPSFFPHKVKFSPVSSVPYWDERCGEKFGSLSEFQEKLDSFLARLEEGNFDSRAYILENLTLEICAQDFANTAKSMM